MNPNALVGLTVSRVVYPRDNGPMEIIFTNGQTLSMDDGHNRSPGCVTLDNEDVEFNV